LLKRLYGCKKIYFCILNKPIKILNRKNIITLTKINQPLTLKPDNHFKIKFFFLGLNPLELLLVLTTLK
ncbi:MAG: hypothetical protein Q8L27_00050, partial [archaeon]|nr:hypothetical protein [archaeon]